METAINTGKSAWSSKWGFIQQRLERYGFSWWTDGEGFPKGVTAHLQPLCNIIMCSGTIPNWALSKIPWTLFKDIISKDQHYERYIVFMSAATPWTVALQAPLSMEFSRQEYWSGFSFPSPGDLPNPRIEPGFPTIQADSLSSEPPKKPKL